MRQGEAMDFGIIGMGVMPIDIRMRDALKSQDFLYTLTEKTPDGQQSSRVIGSIIDYLYTPEDPAHAVAVLADAAIKIVSLTVTEGGYNFDHVRGEFNFDNPQVAADIADLKAGKTEGLRTVYGHISAELIARHAANTVTDTVMSCDNIQGDGEMAHRMFLSFAGAISAELGTWIDGNVPFPNAMVGRNTPDTTRPHREDLDYVDA